MTDFARLKFDVDDSELRRAGTSLDRLTGRAQKAGRATSGVGRAAKQVTPPLRAAGGSVGNLTAQFNDIGLMLASGQSPMLLAAQQGGQVAQVLQQMGRQVGVLGALRAGFKSFISPVQLATFGIIAGGAALVQWARKAIAARRETRSLTEVMEDLSDSFTAYKAAQDAALVTADELVDKYGSVAEQMREVERAGADLKRQALDDELRSIAEALAGEGAFRPAALGGFALMGAAGQADLQAAAVEATKLREEFRAVAAELEAGGGELDTNFELSRRLLALGTELVGLSTLEKDEQREIVEQLHEQVRLRALLIGQEERQAEVAATYSERLKETNLRNTRVQARGERLEGPSYRERLDATSLANTRVQARGERLEGPTYSERLEETNLINTRVRALGEKIGDQDESVWEGLGERLQQTLSYNFTRAIVSGDWSSLGMTFVSSIAEALLKPLADQAFQALFGSLFGGVFHEGGIVPGRRGQAVPIIAQGGEAVLTPRQQREFRGGDIAITIQATGDITDAMRRGYRKTARELAAIVTSQQIENRLLT